MRNYIFFLHFFLSSCDWNPFDREDSRVNIVNKSKSAIYYVVIENSNFGQKDNPLGKLGSDKHYKDRYKIPPNIILPRDSAYVTRDNWERLETFYTNSNQLLHIYIYKEEIIKLYSWRDIIDKNLYSKQYKLKVNDIREKKWRIVYE